MANSTFNGPVRSDNGFETISKNATTGAVTIEADYNVRPNFRAAHLQEQVEQLIL